MAGAVTVWVRRVHAGTSATVAGVAAIGWPAASNQRGTTPNCAPATSERAETASVSCSPASTGIRLASLNTRGEAPVAVTRRARAPSAAVVVSAAIVASAACVPSGRRRSNELAETRLATGASLPWSVASSSSPKVPGPTNDWRSAPSSRVMRGAEWSTTTSHGWLCAERPTPSVTRTCALWRPSPRALVAKFRVWLRAHECPGQVQPALARWVPPTSSSMPVTPERSNCGTSSRCGL